MTETESLTTRLTTYLTALEKVQKIFYSKLTWASKFGEIFAFAPLFHSTGLLTEIDYADSPLGEGGYQEDVTAFYRALTEPSIGFQTALDRLLEQSQLN